MAKDAAGYDDLPSAARAALRGIKAIDGEQAGAILKDPSGKYYATTPITSAQHDHFDFGVGVQKGWSLAGIYHTHPGNDDAGQYFSPDDLNVAHQLNVPSYIRFLKDDSIRSYTPGKTATSRMQYDGSPFGLKVARGDPVPDPPPQSPAPTATVPVNNINPLSASTK